MKLEEQLMDYKNMARPEPREEKMQKAISRSMEAFLKSEQEKMLSGHEFLWTQLRVIRKRWWVFQLLLLLALWAVLMVAHKALQIPRSMGVTASLFVILIIPEFWKNKSCQCMEIEGASYYPLKKIYAARTLLFGIADVFFITMFCWMVSARLRLGLEVLVVQFLFPLTVTACICFRTLCSKYSFNEISAIGFCIMWSAVWLFIILDEKVYALITFPIWLSLLGAAFIYLAIMIYRILMCRNKYWEVLFDGSEV